LDNAGKWVRSGGHLVYSTCSLEPEEGEKVIFAFLENHPKFEIVRPSLMDTAKSAMTRSDFVRTYPQMHGSDGFFAAVLRKGL